MDGLRNHPVTGQGLPADGTNVLTNIINEAGGYPTYNFKDGRYADANKISGETQAETENARAAPVSDSRVSSWMRHPLFRNLL